MHMLIAFSPGAHDFVFMIAQKSAMYAFWKQLNVKKILIWANIVTMFYLLTRLPLLKCIRLGAFKSPPIQNAL